MGDEKVGVKIYNLMQQKALHPEISARVEQGVKQFSFQLRLI